MTPPQQQPHIIGPPALSPTRCASCLINVCSLRLHHILIKRSLCRLLEDSAAKQKKRTVTSTILRSRPRSDCRGPVPTIRQANARPKCCPQVCVGSSPSSEHRSHSVRLGTIAPCFTGAFQQGRMIGRKTKRKQIKKRC